MNTNKSKPIFRGGSGKFTIPNMHNVFNKLKDEIFTQQRKEKKVYGREITVRSASAARQIVYGEMMVGGVEVFAWAPQSTDLGSGISSGWLHRVIAVAGHEIEGGLFDLYLDGYKVNFGASPDPRWSLSSDNPLIGTKMANKVFMAIMTGADDQEAQPDLLSIANLNFPGLWGSDHRLLGTAYAYLILTFDNEVFPEGLPSVEFKIRGKKVYDPRIDSWEWSDNAALIAYDYMTDTRFGCAIPATQIDTQSIEDAADVCDELVTLADASTETRYTINCAFDCDSDKRAVLEDMRLAMAGRILRQGDKWRIMPGKYRAPTLTLTQDDLRGPINIQTNLSRSDLFNKVTGTFIDKRKNFEESDFPPVKNDLYRDLDGEELIHDIALGFVTSHTRAQRIAKIFLEYARQSVLVRAAFSLKAWNLLVTDTVNLSIEKYGWQPKIFEVLSFSIEEDDGSIIVILELKETASAIWDWDAGSETNYDIAPNTSLPNPFNVRAPTNLVLSSGTDQLYKRLDGTIFTRLKIAWSAPSDSFITAGGTYEIQYKKTADADWIFAATIPGSQLFYFLLDVHDGQSYDVRVRSKNGLNVVSAWLEGAHTIIGKTAAPSNVENFNASADDYGILLRWNEVTDLDVLNYEIRIGATWDTATFLAITSGSNYRWLVQLAQTYTFTIKAIDTSGNYSTTATAATLTIDAPNMPEVSARLSGENLILSWLDTKTKFAIDTYKILYGDEFSEAVSIATTKSLFYLLKVDWAGIRKFWIVSRDVAGNESEPGLIDIQITVPGAVSSLVADVIDNNVFLRWRPPLTGSLPVAYFNIFRGDIFGSAQNLGRQTGHFAAFFETVAATYLYWLQAVDSAGNAGAESVVSVVVSAPPDFELVTDIELDPTLAETRTNIIIEGYLEPESSTPADTAQLIGILGMTGDPGVGGGGSGPQPVLTIGYGAEIQDLLANPEIGLQSTQETITTVTSSGRNPHSYPSTSQTYRVHWSEVEASEGSYNFSVITSALNAAAAAGQKANFRVIAGEPSIGVPTWVTAYSGYTATVTYSASPAAHYPNWANTNVKTAFRNLITAIAAAFKNHAGLGVIDVGSFGLYGELHFDDTVIVSKQGTGAPGTIGAAIPMPSNADIEDHIDDFMDAGWKTGQEFTVCIGDQNGHAFDYATGTRGTGWRGDWWGYRPNSSSPGFHMGTLAPSELGSPTTANTIWQNGIIALEPYNAFYTGTDDWIEEGWNYAQSFQWALDHHASLINTKSNFAVPVAMKSSYENMIRKLGYRHVIRQIRHFDRSHAGNSIDITIDWENVGVAPSYNSDHVVAFRFKNQVTGTSAVALTVDPATWLPGTITKTHTVTIPTSLDQEEWHDVGVSIVDKNTQLPVVKLAISGRDAQGWYNLTEMYIGESLEAPAPTPSDYALEFDGVDDYGSVASHADFGATSTQSIYCALWVKLKSNSANKRILVKGAALSATQNWGLHYFQSTNLFRCSVGNGTTINTRSASSEGALNLNQWYFVEFWFDHVAKTLNICVDGGTVDSVSVITPASTSDPIRFANDSSGTAFNNCVIDKVAIYNAVPSSTIRSFLYNSGLGRNYADLTASEKTSLVSYYDCDSNSALTDAHGSNTGTITSAPALANGAPS